MVQLPEYLARAPVGRAALPRETLEEHQRARIVDAAIGVFAKRGYAATTIDNIVAASKTSVGGFYGLFDGKEDCFLGVYDRILAETLEEVAEASAPGDAWSDRAYLGLRRLLQIVGTRPFEARIALIEVQTAGSAATDRYNALMDAATDWFGRGRDHHSEAEALPRSFEQAAVAGIAFLLQQKLLGSEPLGVDELLADTVQLVLEPMVGSAEMRRLERGTAPIGT
jgi:AcrR family transcriptional regulator